MTHEEYLDIINEYQEEEYWYQLKEKLFPILIEYDLIDLINMLPKNKIQELKRQIIDDIIIEGYYENQY